MTSEMCSAISFEDGAIFLLDVSCKIGGLWGGCAGFSGMITIVQTDTDEFPDPGVRRANTTDREFGSSALSLYR